MPEAGDLSDSEIEIFSEEIVALSVVRGTGGVCDFLQGFVDGEAVFELTSIGEIDRVLVEEYALKFFAELVLVVVLSDSGVDIFGMRVEECFCGERYRRLRRGKSFGLCLFLFKVDDLL